MLKANYHNVINYLQSPITSDEIEKYTEIDELGGINNDIYLSNVSCLKNVNDKLLFSFSASDLF